MEDDDLSLEEMYALSKRDPSKAYAPDKDNPPKRKTKDKDKKKDKDKDKDNPSKEPKEKLQIKRVLVRNPDGTMGVEFQDVETGRTIKNPYADNKHEITAGDFSDVFGKSKKKKTSEEETSAQPDDDDGNEWAVPRGGGFQGDTIQASKSPSAIPTAANVSPKGFVEPAEQGDMTDVNGGWIDLTTDAPNLTKSDAVPSSLDQEGFTYTAGNNTHPMEGKNLNEVQVAGDYNRQWDQAAIDKAARTLAGEIDLSQTDLSTPEGIAEARGILSTIENRDIANGPNKGVIETISAPKAYSTWNNDELAGVANANFEKNPGLYTGLVQGYLEDPSSRMNYTNYLNEDVVQPGPDHWANNLEDKTQIGPHTFGVDTSISSKVNTQPMTPAQIDQVSTDIVNQNFQQGFAYPASMDIAMTAPTIDTTGVQTDPSLSGFADGYAAQRDFMPTQQIKEDLNVSGPLSTVAMQNPTQIIQNQISQFNQDTINQGMDIAGTAPNIPSTVTGVEDGFASAPSSFMSTPTQPSISQQDVNRAFFNATAANEFDPSFTAGLMGPNNAVVPTAVQSQSFTPSMGMGFGDYVSTTQSPGLTDFGKDVADARINDQVSTNNAATISAGMDIASTAPSVAATANAVDAFSGSTDATSAGAGSGTSSTSTSGMSPGGYAGGGDSAGGFASSSSTDSSGVTSSTGTSGSGFGGFGGIFGGDDSDTDTDSTSGGSDGFL